MNPVQGFIVLMHNEILYIISLSIFLTLGCNKPNIEPSSSFVISNSINGHNYEICITEQNPNKGGANNVIFLLDADVLTPIILSEYAEKGIAKSLIIVGVKSKEDGKRVRDYSPTEINSEESGEAREFFTFIKEDLLPELKSREIINSSSNTTLLGHSMGGLATSYAFTSFNDVFNNYVALSPSLFWDEFVFFEIENEKRDSLQTTNKNVFIGIGENEDFGIRNGYVRFKEILETNYQNIQLKTKIARGSHYGSRGELINQSFNIILK